MGMSIDEAIVKYEKMAEEQNQLCTCNDPYNFSQPTWKQRAEEYKQIAKWFRQLKKVNQIIAQHDADKMPEDYWYIDRIREVIND